MVTSDNSDLMMGILLTKWTIRLALACFVLCVAGSSAPHSDRRASMGRILWTLGCALFVVHGGCAFHFYRHGSHAAAWQSTAEKTATSIGVPFGDGIFFSYAFLA